VSLQGDAASCHVRPKLEVVDNKSKMADAVTLLICHGPSSNLAMTPDAFM
jgi:hypothetical protein